MEFPDSVTIWRRKRVPSSNDPSKLVLGDWDTAEQITLEGSYIGSSSRHSLRNETRVQALEARSLYVDNPDADVRKGDGVSVGVPGDMPDFEIEVVPIAPKSPFTEWRPMLEVPLKGAHS